MSLYATEYDPSQPGVAVDLDELFKSGSGTGQTWFSQEGQDLAQRYAPFTTNKLPFNTHFVARDGRDLTEWFEARPPQADLTWDSAVGSGNTPLLPPHAFGDMILVLAFRSGATTSPTLPSGYTNIDTAVDGGSSARVGYKIATSAAEPNVVWTNATSWMVLIIGGGATYVDFAESTSQWPANPMARPGSNIGLHIGASLSSGTNWTPYPDDTVEVGSVVGEANTKFYAGYTGLVSSLTAAPFGAGTGNFAVGWTIELQPLQPFVPEMEGDYTEGASGDVPPHVAGDVIIVCARNSGAAVIPSLAAGFTNVVTGSGSGVPGAVRVGYKVAASSSETSGTWTNADDIQVVVAKGVDSIGASAVTYHENTGSGNYVQYPALALQYPGQSGILCFGMTTGATAALPGPTSLQPLSAGVAVSSYGSYGLFSSWAQVQLASSTNGTLGVSIELKVTGAPLPLDGTVTLGIGDGYGYTTGWSGPASGAWSGNPSNLRDFVYWSADGETWLSRVDGSQIGGANTISVSLDGGAPITMTWYAPNSTYFVSGDPFNLTGKPKGVPYTLTGTVATTVLDKRVALNSEFNEPAPTEPSDEPINYGGKIV